jgi:cytochrome c oxidase cbb3-type subunit II
VNRLSRILLGVFVLFGLPWLGLAVYPYLTFAELKQHTDPNTKEVAPPGVPGAARQGYRVYAANGCVYCHSQFIRDKGDGGDIDRGWGKRRTVARDYILDDEVFLGVSRFGPDLTNVGVRQKDAQWYYRYLYDARQFNPGTVMPPYRYLFRDQPIAGQPSLNALKLEGHAAARPGHEIVPTPEAEALVAYLLSLKRDYALPEAPEPKE